MGEGELQAENLLREQMENPMVRLSYAYATDLIQARLRLINADLTDADVKTIDIRDTQTQGTDLKDTIFAEEDVAADMKMGGA